MTKAKKESVKKTTESESTPKGGNGSKEEILVAIDGAKKNLDLLRTEVENDESPDITIFVVTCNENTSRVGSSVYGNGQGLSSTMTSVIDRNPSLKPVFTMALMMAD